MNKEMNSFESVGADERSGAEGRVTWDNISEGVEFSGDTESVVAAEGDGGGVQMGHEYGETGRQNLEDREGIDATLEMLGKAAVGGELSPEDARMVELSLDVMDEVSDQLDDEENTLSAREILMNLSQKYERLAKKAPTEDRKRRYSDMSTYAYQQMKQQGERKEQPKPGSAGDVFQKLSELV